jgi:hypothetical protein
LLGEIPPSDGDPNSRLGLIQRAKRRFKPKPSVPTGSTESFGQIESNATNRPPHLRSKIPIFALNRLNEWPRQRNDRERMFNNR